MTGASRIGRRGLLVGVVGTIAAPAIVRAESEYPSRPVRYISPFPAGGPTDTLSRLFCGKMSELSGQQWVVENRGGSGGNVGVDVLSKSEPDGYTLGLGGISSHAIAPTLYAKLPFDPRKDFTFVSTIWWLPNLLAVNLDLPAGQIHMMFDNIPGTLTQSRAGKVRPIAVTSAKRTAVAPDIPALAETLPGFDIVSWTTLTGPANLPPKVIERLSTLSKRALESDEIKAKFTDLGAMAW